MRLPRLLRRALRRPRPAPAAPPPTPTAPTPTAPAWTPSEPRPPEPDAPRPVHRRAGDAGAAAYRKTYDYRGRHLDAGHARWEAAGEHAAELYELACLAPGDVLDLSGDARAAAILAEAVAAGPAGGRVLAAAPETAVEAARDLAARGATFALALVDLGRSPVDLRGALPRLIAPGGFCLARGLDGCPPSAGGDGKTAFETGFEPWGRHGASLLLRRTGP